MNRIVFYCLLPIFLAACAGMETPQMIASHSFEEPIAMYPSMPITYDATIELGVTNVEKAAKKAVQIASAYEGYLLNSQTWLQEGDKHISLTIIVPANNFESFRVHLLRLGDLRYEHVWSEDDSWNGYSEITIHIHPKASSFSSISFPDWRPIRTILNAWEVFVAMFGFLLDIAIWIVVVLGPFVLMGWLAQKIMRRKPKS